MKILKKGGGVVEKRGEEETKSMPHAPVQKLGKPWSWMILTRKKGEKNQGHFHLVSKHILNIYSLWLIHSTMETVAKSVIIYISHICTITIFFAIFFIFILLFGFQVTVCVQIYLALLSLLNLSSTYRYIYHGIIIFNGLTTGAWKNYLYDK